MEMAWVLKTVANLPAPLHSRAQCIRSFDAVHSGQSTPVFCFRSGS